MWCDDKNEEYKLKTGKGNLESNNAKFLKSNCLPFEAFNNCFSHNC